MTTVDIIIPTIARPAKLATCLQWIREHSPSAGVIVVTEDSESADVAHQFDCTCIESQPGTAPQKWNVGAAASQADWFMLGADDVFLQEHWFEQALYANVGGYVGLRSAGDRGHYWFEHYCISREFAIQHMGGCLVIPAYHHLYIDVEATHRAMRAQCVASTRGIVCEHRHWSNGGAPMDAIYQRIFDGRAEDMKIFERRRLAGWPDDFEPVVTEVRDAIPV